MPKSIESRINALEKRGPANHIEAIMKQMTAEELQELVEALQAVREERGEPSAQLAASFTEADERRVAGGLRNWVVARREQKSEQGSSPAIRLAFPVRS